MSGGSFNALGNAYGRDPIATGHRETLERERQTREQQRAEQWLATVIVAQSFTSREQLETMACAAAVNAVGRALTESERTRVIAAARSLYGTAWLGQSFEITDAGRALLAASPAQLAIGARVTVVSGPDVDESGEVVGARDGMLRVRLDRHPTMPYWFLATELHPIHQERVS